MASSTVNSTQEYERTSTPFPGHNQQTQKDSETFNLFHIESDGKIVHLNPPASPDVEENLTIDLTEKEEKSDVNVSTENDESLEKMEVETTEKENPTYVVDENPSDENPSEVQEENPSVESILDEAVEDNNTLENGEDEAARLRYYDFHCFLEKLVKSHIEKNINNNIEHYEN